jgi:AraC-like DNA-binding protein
MTQNTRFLAVLFGPTLYFRDRRPSFTMDDLESESRPFRYVLEPDPSINGGLHLSAVGQSILSGDAADGHGELRHFHSRPDSKSRAYYVTLIASGKGLFQSASQNLVIEAGDGVVVFPAMWHRFRVWPDCKLTLRYIRLEGPFLDHYVENQLLQSTQCVAILRDPSAVTASFQRIVKEMSRERPGNPLLIAAIGLEMLAEICWAIRTSAHESPRAPLQALPRWDPIVIETLNLIWDSPTQSMSVHDLAKQLPISRRSLERRFQEATGSSLLHEIIACRLERAKCLLLETKQPLARVARDAGFTTCEAMARAFQKRLGTTPSRFRKEGKH